jgi:hypothetical protein
LICHFLLNYHIRKSIIILRCVSKKTALLQAEASACVSELANVLFCALAFHFFFFFLSLSSKLSVRFCLFTLTANGLGLCVRAGFEHKTVNEHYT